MEYANKIIHGDCLETMNEMPDGCVDLVFGSPPYVNARTYGIDFSLTGQDWVNWMANRVIESLRICRGLVAFVIEGKTKNFRWDATPALLMADLHRNGVHLRKPPVFNRVGIPGSGGPDWLRNDYELILCCTNGGKLPWSNNTAKGKPPKWKPGGEISHRMPNGRRVNKLHTKNDGKEMRLQGYNAPKLANPGNVIHCKVGGGRMGDMLCHENEAPFPEDLADFFIQSFCPPGGVVLDPFCGSGTTCAVAKANGRQWTGIEIRQSQVDLSNRRIEKVVPCTAKDKSKSE